MCLLFGVCFSPTFGQVSNIRAGLWSDVSCWNNASLPNLDDTVSLNYDIVIDINANCKFLNANGHNVIINTGINLNVAGIARPADSTFLDSRDGQTYKFKHIGSQVWMTQNLNYSIQGSWCYANNASNCAVYGRLYEWDAAIGAAPPGWHVPSDSEWDTLITFLGGYAEAGGKMKSTNLWAAPNEGATNSSGISCLPGGFGYSNGIFNSLRFVGNWWSSTADISDTSKAWYRGLDYSGAGIDRLAYFKFVAFSIRCIRD